MDLAGVHHGPVTGDHPKTRGVAYQKRLAEWIIPKVLIE
jgi:hypothetical protein